MMHCFSPGVISIGVKGRGITDGAGTNCSSVFSIALSSIDDGLFVWIWLDCRRLLALGPAIVAPVQQSLMWACLPSRRASWVILSCSSCRHWGQDSEGRLGIIVTTAYIELYQLELLVRVGFDG